MTNKERLQKFIDSFRKEKLAQKYLYNRMWLSGGQTMVHPITISDTNIVFQWGSDKKIFDKFIKKIVKENSDLFSDGYFWKSDGSCPSTITFKFK